MIHVGRLGTVLTIAGMTFTPDEADHLADIIRVQVAEVRRDTARALCAVAGGHQWDGYDAWTPGMAKIRHEWCTRPHCDTERQFDGWGQRW